MSLKRFQKKYNLQLNKQQQAAVQTIKGPALLLAVPGSGKTTVIVARVGYMMLEKNIAPSQILTLTFSKAAAEDMGRRFSRTFGVQRSPKFATIHSFCYGLLMQYYQKVGRKLPDLVASSHAVIRSLLPGFPTDLQVRESQLAIGYAKNMQMEEEDMAKMQVEGVSSFVQLFDGYNAHLRSHGLIDFDDMLTGALHLLRQDRQLLYQYQNHYPYINIDEAQDTSKVQHEIIQLLAQRDKNIFMVGDEDQSIYGFRAAYPEALLNFDKTYPDAKVLLMETNFRSTPQITQSADQFIKQNRQRRDKNMHTPNRAGAAPVYKVLDTAQQQYQYLLQIVQNKKKDDSLAIIYRNNTSAIPVMDLLDGHGIEYRIREDNSIVQDLLDAPVIRDVLLLMQLAEDPHNWEVFEQVYYKLELYLSKDKDLPYIRQTMAQAPQKTIADVVAEMSKRAGKHRVKKMRNFPHTLRRIHLSRPDEGISCVLHALGYADWMRKTQDRTGDSYGAQMAKVNILRLMAKKHESLQALLEHLNHLGTKNAGEQPSANIWLTTMHASKGLEFDRVVIIDTTDNIIPMEDLGQGVLPTGVQAEEEVRLFYVAITRARKQLTLLAYRKFFESKIHPSVFLRQLEGKEPIQKGKPARATPMAEPMLSADVPIRRVVKVEHSFKEGDVVEHKLFGRGTIAAITPTDFTIQFKVERKILDANTCVQRKLIEKVEE